MAVALVTAECAPVDDNGIDSAVTGTAGVTGVVESGTIPAVAVLVTAAGSLLPSTLASIRAPLKPINALLKSRSVRDFALNNSVCSSRLTLCLDNLVSRRPSACIFRRPLPAVRADRPFTGATALGLVDFLLVGFFPPGPPTHTRPTLQ